MEELHSDDDDDLALHSSTLAALALFIEEQSAAQQALVDLNARYSTGLESQGHGSEQEVLNEGDEEQFILRKSECRDVVVSLKEFKLFFKEDWQLSQFWYSEDTATRLTDAILRLSKPTSRIAFLCCPTGYVAYKEKAPHSQPLRLFEYDTRFSVFARNDFVKYDLDEPLHFPSQTQEEMHHSQDIVIIDPPFHAQASQKKLAITIRHILRPGGYLVLLTGTSLTPMLDEIYGGGLPKLRRRKMSIEHDGTGRLETPYGCWLGGGEGEGNNGDWDESGFGGLLD